MLPSAFLALSVPEKAFLVAAIELKLAEDAKMVK